MNTLYVFGAAVSSTEVSVKACARQQALSKRLCEMIRSGVPLEQITKLVAAGADVNKKEALGLRPLIAACAKGRLDVVRYLLAQGAFIYDDNEYATALSFTKSGAIAEILLARGANPHGTTYGRSELVIAADQMHDYEKFKHLLEYGARINEGGSSTCQNALHSIVHNSLHVFQRFSREQNNRVRDLYLGDDASAHAMAQAVQEIVPITRLLLWNGSRVTAETLKCLQVLFLKEAYDRRGHPEVENNQSIVRQRLLELQEVLLDPYQEHMRPTLIHNVSAMNIARSARCVIYPYPVHSKRTTNVFLQLSQRQAGHTNTLRAALPASDDDRVVRDLSVELKSDTSVENHVDVTRLTVTTSMHRRHVHDTKPTWRAHLRNPSTVISLLVGALIAYKMIDVTSFSCS